MNFLLDTNVVSEGLKPQPNANVIQWLADADEDRLYLSVVTLAEICRGIERLDPGRKRSQLKVWLEEELPARFENRVLEVDAAIANAWGRLMILSARSGTQLGAMDAFFAATAQVRGLTFVTRNTKDFQRLGIRLFNPWLLHAE